MLEAALAAGVAAARRPRAARRRAAHAGRLAARAPLRLRPGGGRVRVAQPVPGQRHQVLRPRGHEARRRPGGARSSGLLERAGRRRASAACASCTARPGDYLRELEPRFATSTSSGARPARLRERRHLPRGARDLPPPRRRRGRLAVEPDGRNINDGCGSTHVERARRARIGRPRRRLRLRRRRRPGAGRRPQRRGRRRRRADRAGRAPPARARPPARRRRGRDRDDELRLPQRDGEAGHRGGHHPGRRPPRAGRAAPRGWALGGEQSGHIIDTGFVPAGDGIAAALLDARGARRGATSPSATRWRSCPQRLVNVRVADRDGARAAPPRSGRRSSASRSALEGRGRVLVRPSGTEPLVRVMVEAPQARRRVRRLVRSWSVGSGRDVGGVEQRQSRL